MYLYILVEQLHLSRDLIQQVGIRNRCFIVILFDLHLNRCLFLRSGSGSGKRVGSTLPRLHLIIGDPFSACTVTLHADKLFNVDLDGIPEFVSPTKDNLYPRVNNVGQ